MPSVEDEMSVLAMGNHALKPSCCVGRGCARPIGGARAPQGWTECARLLTSPASETHFLCRHIFMVSHRSHQGNKGEALTRDLIRGHLEAT